MKKIILLIGASALGFLLMSCSAAPEKADVVEQLAQRPPVWDQELLQGYLERESDAEMSYAGPFYFGSFDGALPSSQNYSAQRREKVDEIIAVIDEGIDALVKLDKKLREEKEILEWYVKEIQAIDESTKDYTDQVLGATKGSILSQSLSDLMVMSSAAEKAERGSAWGFLQFQKYGALVELTNFYTVEAGSLMSRSVALYYLLESDPNSAYQDLNKQFTEKMDPISEEVSGLLSELYYLTAVAGYGEKLIFTADHYFAKDTMALVDKEIAEAKKAIEDYNGSNELLSEPMLELLKTKLQDIEAYRNNIVVYLESIPEDELIARTELAMGQEEGGNALVPVARAQMDIPGWFQKKIKDTVRLVKNVKDLSMAAVRVTGQQAKDLYDKSGAHEVVKDGAQMINGGIEFVNSGVEVGVHGIQGIYYGDMTWDDFKKKIEDEKNELYDKFVQGKLGKEQYDEMIHQVDQFQKNTGRFIENMSEFAGDMTGIISGQPKVGKFVKNVTKNVGDEAKKVLDTATDFSKNIAIIMHPETTKQQTREAMLNIYTALQGIKDEEGELVKVTLPDLSGLAKEKALEQAAKELGLNQEEEKEFLDQLKDIFQEQLKDEESGGESKKDAAGKKETSSEEPKAGGRSDAISEIFTNPGLTDEQIRDLILAEIMKDLPPVSGEKKEEKDEEEDKDADNDGIENKYDNCENVSNPNQTDTDLDGLGDACDPDCSGDGDGDELCDEIDNCPGSANPDQADADNDGMGNMCDFDAPHISEIAGTWPGSITVTSVYISEELRAQAEGEGCDIERIEESKDEVKPISVTITPTSETGGTLSVAGTDAGDQQMSFTYVDGVLKAAKSEEGASMNIQMSFNRSTSSGMVDLEYLGGQAKVQAKMDLSK